MFCSLFQYLILFFFIITPLSAGRDECSCNISRCGDNGPPIRFPFWLKNMQQPERCGYPGFELSCDHKNQTLLELPGSVKLVVNYIIYGVDVILAHNPYSCIPRQLLSLNLSASSPFDSVNAEYMDIFLFNCSPPEREIPYLVPCGGQYQVYAVDSYNIDDYIYKLTSCNKIGEISQFPLGLFPLYTGNLSQISEHQNRLLHLTWKRPYCSKCEREGKICNIKNYNTTAEPIVECLYMANTTPGSSSLFEPSEVPPASKLVLSSQSFSYFQMDPSKNKYFSSVLTDPPKKSKSALVIGLVTGLVLVVIIALYCAYTSQRRKKKDDQVKVDVFLEDYKALRPTRYSFADIKRITNQFKEKLGAGAHGTVFKGKLSSEIFVAVKVLSDSVGSGSGDEFINAVGTMGTIHHVNVVRLVGFCTDGTNQALVYEFLPNDSLEKFVFSKKQENHFLGWQKLQDIALGIAKGIEYLHQGCEQRILHFDIKPHNILLDHNFNPKIADFGLAKLCSKDQSIVSMTAARGTMGYIAPEVFSRNFGNVSYKSDVYSFGMVLLEMVGGSKNIDVTVQNTSQTYFPEWIYNRLCQGQELGIIIEEEEHAQIAKRLVIIGLWCIQWNPVVRPSIKTVVQMLERKGDTLVMPPNPFPSTIQSESSSSKPARVLNTELAVISEAE